MNRMTVRDPVASATPPNSAPTVKPTLRAARLEAPSGSVPEAQVAWLLTASGGVVLLAAAATLRRRRRRAAAGA